MTRTKLALLGLCAMMFSALAFSTTAAQAEVGAQWLFAKSDGTLIPFLEATGGSETDVPGVLHTKLAGVSVLFSCTTSSNENLKLKANGTIGTGAKIKLSGCTTQLNGVASKACEPNSGGKEPGVIRSNAGHGLLVLHKLPSGVIDDVFSVLPDVGETFATIEMSEECSIGEKVPVIGKGTIKDCEGLGLTHLLKHLIEVGPLTELWVLSKTAEHAATVLGSAWIFLTGEHAGLKASGDPA
jgi:hypothetical protein